MIPGTSYRDRKLLFFLLNTQYLLNQLPTASLESAHLNLKSSQVLRVKSIQLMYVTTLAGVLIIF